MPPVVVSHVCPGSQDAMTRIESEPQSPDRPTSAAAGAARDATDALLSMDLEIWPVLEIVSRALHVREADLQQTLDAVLSLAARVVPGARFAGLNLFVKGRFVPQAVFGAAPHELDLVQQSTGRGPCVDASREQATITVADMRLEDRWVEFVERALELGVLSMLCVPLWVDDLRVGSLSLYATEPDAFGAPTSYVAGLLASHAALALADAQRTAHLRQALLNRDVIGQAKGILMARRGLTADQAFELLSRHSQNTNRRLVDVAEQVALTGTEPV